MTIVGEDKILRVRLWLSNRDVPVEQLICWAAEAPMPTTSAVVEAMLDGVLFGIDGEALAWDDSAVEVMTVSLIPNLHLRVGDGQ